MFRKFEGWRSLLIDSKRYTLAVKKINAVCIILNPIQYTLKTMYQSLNFVRLGANIKDFYGNIVVHSPGCQEYVNYYYTPL